MYKFILNDEFSNFMVVNEISGGFGPKTIIDEDNFEKTRLVLGFEGKEDEQGMGVLASLRDNFFDNLCGSILACSSQSPTLPFRGGLIGVIHPNAFSASGSSSIGYEKFLQDMSPLGQWRITTTLEYQKRLVKPNAFPVVGDLFRKNNWGNTLSRRVGIYVNSGISFAIRPGLGYTEYSLEQKLSKVQESDRPNAVLLPKRQEIQEKFGDISEGYSVLLQNWTLELCDVFLRGIRGKVYSGFLGSE